jgi:hypothetical protein
MKDMRDLGIEQLRGEEQGFVTDEGEFVDRAQAARIALECGQIKALRYSPTQLFSEELW